MQGFAAVDADDDRPVGIQAAYAQSDEQFGHYRGSPYSLRQGQWVLGVPSMPTPITTAQVIAESSTRPSPARPLAWLSARRAISVAAANRREIADLLVEVAARGSPCQRRRVRRYRWTYRYVHRAAQPRRLVVSRNTQVDRHCGPLLSTLSNCEIEIAGHRAGCGQQPWGL
jgi:hypothetical protein